MALKHKVMIVDDVEINRDLLEAILADMFDIVSVASGEEAIETMKEFVPDIILLDVMLPGIDGCEVCYHIRTNNHLKEMKVLMLSGNSAAQDEKRCMSFGADQYVCKPFEAVGLRNKITKLLEM
ncbi:MAG: hypothetical protein DIZ80_09380 [endosymbiont of Galathealinum brachiosum]|uniref:Response regulatory domain-containing protein n=1 Tax=endosymbiont of Galathealinum brachiosum TaxID=2200906 RepID=A0A370DC55_9GAMM|nr:MAG: hypothetical protein DIZ80_09380 [endosymbiont of Galathealinum brachiosum]